MCRASWPVQRTDTKEMQTWVLFILTALWRRAASHLLSAPMGNHLLYPGIKRTAIKTPVFFITLGVWVFSHPPSSEGKYLLTGIHVEARSCPLNAFSAAALFQTRMWEHGSHAAPRSPGRFPRPLPAAAGSWEEEGRGEMGG